ncbi:putative SIK1-involved in pre-rRNA processing [Armillaria mellea]|nr:putative SIK1-involved in pre-rRNA processing [Armillaria mellea]
MPTHALLETASGYAIFEVKLTGEIEAKSKAFQDSIIDFSKFSKMVSLMSFSPFKSAGHALENANDISESILNDYLKSLVELNLSKPTKKSSIVLAVTDPNLGNSIRTETKVQCESGDMAMELIRGLRLHATKLLKGLQNDDFTKSQLGLGHSYSRAKLKFNVNRHDNMIIQAIALLDQLDKDVNLFSMRIREWYGYHFPELVKLVPDNHQYARLVQFIGEKETLTEEKLPEIEAILDDNSTVAQNILDAARGSMGSSLSEIDMLNISTFAIRVVSLSEYRKSLITYLSDKMNLVAPSLTALLGDRIGARLISHAGSLTNLSKYPASTVQILGAEKALFRALKTKGNTPKYGLIYHSTFIGRAGPKHKGRISRFLANKCSIASRIDCYSGQVEERLEFFEKGTPPSKNADAIRKVLDALAEEEDVEMDGPALTTLEPSPKKEKKKKRKSDAMDVDDDEEASPKKKVKLSKEEKKALKKAEKEKAKKEGAGVFDADVPKKEKKDKKEKKEKKEKKRRRRSSFLYPGALSPRRS